MKVVLISDTHNQTPKLPDGDLLIHAGDGTSQGSFTEICRLNAWFEEIKHKYKHGILYIPGNHDWMFERDLPRALTLMTGAKVLLNEDITIEGFKIYGSPYTPYFHGWAFNKQRGQEINAEWERIPKDVDVLVTHGPPMGVGDLAKSIHAGCMDLMKMLPTLTNLKLHVFGHIHEGYGVYQSTDSVTSVNAALLDNCYRARNKPIEFEL